MKNEIATPADVFAQARDRFQPEKAAGLRGDCEFQLTGTGGGVWSVEVDAGRLDVREGARPKAAVRVTVPADLFVRLATGEADALSALFTGKLKVEGDRDLAYRLSGLFF